MVSRADHLKSIEQRVLWLSHWMIHNANHLRPKVDGIKVGGHQASSASMVSIMTALYFSALRPEDRVAVKPHASPVFHAIQYLMGNQTREKMENFRGYGGVQSYPSRTKDIDDVDFSTGSVGLGVAITSFASLVQDYIQAKDWGRDIQLGRMVALVGDAELDEGNIYECLQEGWKNDLRNTWWIIDYNRQSLDGIVREGLFKRVEQIFDAFGWDVVRVKYGALQRAAFEEQGGEKLRRWIDDCPNQLYAALTFMGGAVWRKRLMDDLGDQGDVSALIDGAAIDELADLMENLGGNCVTTMCRDLRLDRPRPARLLPRLYDQGLGHADCRSQGQSWRPDEQGPDGRLAKAYGRPRKDRNGSNLRRLPIRAPCGLSGRSALLCQRAAALFGPCRRRSGDRHVVRAGNLHTDRVRQDPRRYRPRPTRNSPSGSSPPRRTLPARPVSAPG